MYRWVCDLAVLLRNIEIDADEDTLVLKLEVSD